MATTVRFYPSHSNSIHYNNMAGWGDFVNNTNSTAVGGSAGTKNLNTGNLTLRYESGQFFTENSAQGGQKWQELSRLAFLFNTTSLPDTLSVTGITLSLKVESINNSGTEGWRRDFSIAPYAYNPDSTSSISTAEYDNFGSVAFGNTISSSTFANEQRISFTLTDLDWINADGISQLGLRFLEDVNYDPPSWFPMQWSDVRFFDHNSVTDNRPYIDVTYEDATSYSEVFDERIGTPTTTAPGTITAPTGGTGFGNSLDTDLYGFWTFDNVLTEISDTSGKTWTEVGDGVDFETTKKHGTHSIDKTNSSGSSGVKLADTGGDFTGTNPFSISCWVNFNEPTSTRQIWNNRDHNDGNVGGVEIYYDHSGRKISTYNSSYNNTSDNVISDNTWHHLVFTWDGSESSPIKIYVDGDHENSSSTATNTAKTANDADVHLLTPAEYNMSGQQQIDSVGMWTKELTTTEVGLLYASGDGLVPASGASSGGSTSTLDTGLVSIYNFDGNYNDSKGSNNGTASSGVSQNSSIKKLGTHSAYFSGSADNKIDIGSNSSTFNISNELSISAWIYIPSSSWSSNTLQPILTSQNQGNGSGTQAGISFNVDRSSSRSGGNPPTIHWQHADGSWNHINSTVALPTGEWVHVVATRKQDTNDNDAVYYNGSSKSISRYAQWTEDINWSNANNWMLGSETNHPSEARDFHGYMDQVAIWDKILTSAEVTELYNSGNGKAYDATGGFSSTSTSGADGDAYWYNTTLLINSEDQSFQDKSPSGHTLVASGGAGIQYNETYVKYGSGSLYFDGTGDYLEANNHSDHNFSSSDFTVEAWVYPKSISGYDAIVGIWGHESNRRSWSLELNSGKPSFLTSTGAGTSAITKAESTTALTVDTWNHVAGTLSGTTGKIFVNGELKATNSSMNAPSNNTTDKLYVGSQGTSGTTSYFEGYIDDLRVTKSIVRYTATFTAPTAGFKEYALQGDVSTYGGDEHWDKVSAYYKFNSALTDYSHEDPVITTYRDPAINTDNKVSVGSLKTYISNPRTTKSGFDIRGDSVNFGTGEYTIESWLRLDTKPYYTDGSTDEGVIVDFRETVTDSSETPLDGVLEWVGVEQNTPISSVDDEDFRLTYKLKGSTEVKTSKALVYSAPVTTGDTNWSYVDLLIQCNSTDSDGDDVEGNHAEYSDNNISLTTNSSTVDMSTTISDPWGGSLPSIYLDSEYIIIPANTTLWNNLESKFTFEGWVYQTDSAPSTWATILEFGAHNTGEFGLWINNSEYLHLNWNGPGYNNTGVTMARNNWHHWAIVKDGSTKTLYLNGAYMIHTTSGTNDPQRGSENFYIGYSTHSTSYPFKGYMNDFRITNGVARYSGTSTSSWGNFDKPTAPFPTSATVTGSGEEVVDFKHFAVGRRTPYYPELSSDSGFEGTYSSGVAPSWTKQGSAGTYTEETTIKRSGSKSQKIALSNQGFTTRHDSITQTANKFYRLEAWVYTTVQMDVRIRDYNGASGDTWSTFTVSPNVWTKIFKNPLKKGNTTGQFEINVDTAVTGNIYIDDFSCKEITAKQYIHWGGEQIICIDTPPTKFEGQPVLFGTSEQSNPNSVNSFWDDLRITNGKNRYTVDYDQPTTEFYTYEPPVLKGDEHWDKTVLYMNADKSSILDSSATGHSITSGGTPTVDFTVYKFGAGSIFYDGTNDYNIVGDHVNWDFGTGDFTIEFWIRLTASETQGWLFGWDGESGTNSDWKIGFGMSSGSTRQVEFYDMVGNSSAPVVSATSLNNNGTTWHHVAICRKDNEHKIFIDGSLDKTHTFSGTQSSFNNVTTNRYIGQSASDTTKRFGGYLDEIRITKGQARYTTTVDLQTDVFPILDQYVDYQGEDITVDIDDSSFTVLHGFENLDTMFSANTIQFIGNEMSIIPEISHDPHSANTTALLDTPSVDITYDNDTLFRYQIRDQNSSIIRDVSNSDNRHIYFAYQFDGNTPVYHKMAIASFQTGSPPSSDLWDATYLRGTPDLNKNHYNQEEFGTSDWFETTAVQQTKDNFTANQFIFNAGCSFHMVPDLTTIGTLGSTAGSSDYIPGAISDSTDVLTESHVYDAMEYTGDATLSVTDDSGNMAIFASEELVTETKQELLEDVIDPFDNWATNKVTSFGSNFEFSDGEPNLIHNDFYSVRNDTTEANIDDNDLGDYEFYQGNEIALNPKIIRTLMGSSAYSAEENTVEETDFALEDSIVSVSEFTNAEIQIAGDVLAPVFDERYSYEQEPNSLIAGAVAYWRMENANDSIGSYHGTVNDDAHFSSVEKMNGEYGLALDGTNDWLDLGEISSSDSLALAGSDGTISLWCWMDTDSEGYARLIDKSDGNYGENGYMMICTENSGLIRVGMGSGKYVDFSSVVSSETWTHLVWTWDGTTWTLYKDGSVFGTNTAKGGNRPASTTTNMKIGGLTDSSAREMEGYLDEVGIWNRALTATEVSELYSSGSSLDFYRKNTIFLPDNTITLDYTLKTTLKTTKAVSAREQIQQSETGSEIVEYSPNSIKTNIMARREQFSGSQTISYDTRYAESTVSTGANGLKYEDAGGAVDAYFDLVQFTNEGFLPVHSLTANNDQHATNGAIQHTQLLEDEVSTSDTETDAYFVTDAVVKTYFTVDIPEEDAVAEGDTHFGDVILLVSGDETVSSGTFTETSLDERTVTVTGSTQTNDSTFGKVWTNDGTNDYLTIPYKAEFDFGVVSGNSSDFTIDCWYKSNSDPGAILGQSGSGSVLQINSGNAQWYQAVDSAGYKVTGSTDVQDNAWHHIALVRYGSSLKIYVDGEEDGSETHTTNIGYKSGQDLTIGAWNSNYYNSNISNLRITKGVARWTANFNTDSIITSPGDFQTSTGNSSDDPLYDRVSLLIQSDTTDGSTTFLDGSENVHTIAPNGDVHHDVNQKKFGNTSIYFDGSGDYLSCGSNNVFAFCNGNFTIELWAYHTSLSGQQTYVTDPYGNNADGIYFAKNSSHKVAMYTSSWQITGSTSLSVDTWYHIALVRNNGTLKIYLDGTEDASVSSTTNFAQTQLTIGDSSGTTSGEFVGYMEDIRITRHTARYTSNFTKPSLAFKGATAQTSNNIGSDLPEFEMEDSWFQASPSTSKTYSYDNFTPETFQFDGSGSFVFCVDESITSTRNLDGSNGSQKKSQYKFTGNSIIPVVHYDTYKNGSGESSDYSSSFAQANKPLLTGSTTVSYVKPTETYTPASGGVPGDSNWSDVNVLYNFTSSSYTSGSTQDHKEASTLTTLNGTISVASTPDSDQGLGDYALRFQSGGAYMTNMSSSSSSTFTLEGWVYKDSTNSSGYSYIWECRGENGSGSHALLASANDHGLYMYWGDSNIYNSNDGKFTNDTWHHWAVVRDGTGSNNMKFYWNGEYIVQWSSTSAFAISDWGQRYSAPGSSQYYLDGYMDEIRFTDGVARYSGTSTGVWTNFYSENSGKSSGDAIDYAWATSTSGTSGTPESYTTTFPTITTTAKDRYIDYQYEDSGEIKYWGTTDGQIRPYTSAPNDLTKLHVDEDVGNYLHFIEAKVGHVDWQQDITNELDTDSSSDTYNELVFIQEIEPIGKYKPESFQFSGNENVFIVDARWSNDMLKWLDSNFNAVTEGGVGHNTSIQFTDGKFINTVNKFIEPSGIPVFASKDATEEIVLVEDFSTDVLSPARDYFGSKQVQMQSGSTFLPTLDLSKHFDIDTAEGQFYALASGTFVDITSVFSSSTQKLTLTFSNANQMTDYTVGESTWVGRFEASSSGQSVTLKSNTLYVIDSVNTQTLELVLAVPAGQEATFTPPDPPGEEIAGDVTIITSSQNLAQLYYLLKGI